jgi:spore coat polysaccharide biosynthesis protein SpsF
MTVNKIAIIQARMSSSRLPGKVLVDIAGRPMLEHMLVRTMKARSVDAIVVATTTDPADDVLEQYCLTKAFPCYRGSLPDVLDRMYHTAAQFHADVIIRLTADCPLIDPAVIDLTVAAFLGIPVPQTSPDFSLLPDTGSLITYSCDFAANRLPPPWKRTLPIGLDVEVCSFDALERAWREADQVYQREHVLPYLYEGVAFTQPVPPMGAEWYIEQGTTPRGFHIALLNHRPDYGTLRWTVDTPADLEFVRQVHAHFNDQTGFGWQDVLAVLQREPGLVAINADVQHKSAFDVDDRSPHL